MQNPTQELTLVINVFVTGVSMPEGCDVQVRRNPLRGDRAVDAACASVRLVVVRGFEFVLRPTEDGVEETTGSTRLRDSLTHRKRGGVIFQCSCLSNVELGPVSPKSVRKTGLAHGRPKGKGEGSAGDEGMECIYAWSTLRET